MAKDLDHLLAIHHLFNVAIHNTEVLLLFCKVFARFPSDFARHQQRDTDHRQCKQGEWNVQNHHAAKDAQYCNATGTNLRQALADKLTQGICIIGIDAHDVAMHVGIKITDGQPLHAGKQFHTQISQRSLRDIDHHAGE